MKEALSFFLSPRGRVRKRVSKKKRGDIRRLVRFSWGFQHFNERIQKTTQGSCKGMSWLKWVKESLSSFSICIYIYIVCCLYSVGREILFIDVSLSLYWRGWSTDVFVNFCFFAALIIETDFLSYGGINNIPKITVLLAN